mgnify:FL=1
MVKETVLTKSGIIVLNEKESSLIKRLREIPFGKVTIFMKNGVPQRVEQITESFEL